MSFVMGRPVLMRVPVLLILVRTEGSAMTAVTVELLSYHSIKYTKIEALLASAVYSPNKCLAYLAAATVLSTKSTASPKYDPKVRPE